MPDSTVEEGNNRDWSISASSIRWLPFKILGVLAFSITEGQKIASKKLGARNFILRSTPRSNWARKKPDHLACLLKLGSKKSYHTLYVTYIRKENYTGSFKLKSKILEVTS